MTTRAAGVLNMTIGQQKLFLTFPEPPIQELMVNTGAMKETFFEY